MRLLLVGALAALAGALPMGYHRKPSAALEKKLEQQETTLERSLAKIEALKAEVDLDREQLGADDFERQNDDLLGYRRTTADFEEMRGQDANPKFGDKNVDNLLGFCCGEGSFSDFNPTSGYSTSFSSIQICKEKATVKLGNALLSCLESESCRNKIEAVAREEERKKKAEEEQREKEEQERRAREEKEKEKRLAKEEKEKEELRDDTKVGHPCYRGGETPICAGHATFIVEQEPWGGYHGGEIISEEWDTRCDFAEPMPGACETASGASSKCCRRLRVPVNAPANPHDGYKMKGGCGPVEGAQCRNAFSSAGMETATA